MDTKKELSLFLIFILVLVTVVFAHNFAHYYISKEFSLFSYTSCDPSLHNCFQFDPESGNFSFYSEPYAKVAIIARFAPLCLDEHTCTNFNCSSIPEKCLVTYCDEGSLQEGEICTSMSE